MEKILRRDVLCGFGASLLWSAAAHADQKPSLENPGILASQICDLYRDPSINDRAAQLIAMGAFLEKGIYKGAPPQSVEEQREATAALLRGLPDSVEGFQTAIDAYRKNNPDLDVMANYIFSPLNIKRFHFFVMRAAENVTATYMCEYGQKAYFEASGVARLANAATEREFDVDASRPALKGSPKQVPAFPRFQVDKTCSLACDI